MPVTMHDVELELSVRITYRGQKKRFIDDWNFQTVIIILRSDLLRLKIPHPRVENISIVYTGCVQFTWRTQKDGTLHRQLVPKVRTPDRDVTNELLIESITLQQKKIPQSAINADYPYSRRLRSRLRPSVYDSLSDVLRSPSHATETSENYDKSVQMRGEAQKLLDSVMTDHSEESSVFASTQPGPSSWPRASPPPIESSSTFGRKRTPPPSSVHTSKPPAITTSLGHNTPASAPPARAPVPETDPSHAAGTTNGLSLSHRLQPIHVANPSVSFSPARPATQSFVPNEPIEPFRHNGSRSSPPSTTPDLQGPLLAPQQSHTVHPQIKTEDSSTINRLNQELRDTRHQIAALVAQEVVILGQLRALGAPSEAQAQSTILSDDFVAKKDVKLIEAELRNERRKRADAEQLIKDVERECRRPFVVPALLDAFAAISRLSGEAMT